MSYRVLVPLDGSKLAEGAIPVAIDLVRRSKGSMRAIRVHEPALPIATVGDLAVPFYDPAWDDQLRKIARDYLSKIAEAARPEIGNAFSTAVCDGAHVPDEIERAAADFSADLIVMTTHGQGGSALAWLGSVADGVVRSTHRLVLVIPERAANAPLNVQHILVAVDGSNAAAGVVGPAADLAKVYGASLSLVRVVAPPLIGDVLTALSTEGLDRFGVDRIAEAAKAQVDAIAAPIRARGVKVESIVLVHPNPARALLEHIEQTAPDLVAMGTHGRGMSRLFVGSVVDKVLRGSGRPSLILRPAIAEHH